MLTKKHIYCVAVCLISFAPYVNSSVVSVTGDFQILPIPSNLEYGSVRDATVARVFDERQNVTLTSDLLVDYLVSGTGGTYVAPFSTAATIAAGTTVSSQLIHADSGLVSLEAIGELFFDQPIIAIIGKSQTLVASDGALGVTGVTYESGNGGTVDGNGNTTLPDERGGEGFAGGALDVNDYFSFGCTILLPGCLPDVLYVNQITTGVHPGGVMDEFRVITAGSVVPAVPVPGAVWLFGSGLLGLIGMAKRSPKT